jgi:rubrerythrin
MIKLFIILILFILFIFVVFLFWAAGEYERNTYDKYVSDKSELKRCKYICTQCNHEFDFTIEDIIYMDCGSTILDHIIVIKCPNCGHHEYI